MIRKQNSMRDQCTKNAVNRRKPSADRTDGWLVDELLIEVVDRSMKVMKVVSNKKRCRECLSK